MSATLTIPAGFNGPPGSANGGYACGRLAAMAAAHLGGPVGVVLHAPVPLELALAYEVSGRRGHAWAGGELVATVSRANRAIPAVEPVSPEQAKAAEAGYAGYAGHPFPTCYVCGVDRSGDGLRLAPGPLPGRPGSVACTWVPDRAGADGTVPPEIVWSVLDCPGGWTTDPVAEPRVLAWMSAEVLELPRAGRGYVIVGRLDGTAGRATTNITALYDAAGTLLGRAAATWVPAAA
jgi:hypothetical protein